MRKRTVLQIIVVSILSLTLAPVPASDNGRATVPGEQQPAFGAEASFRPLEVRTRRLHMVRPDLIHYPISYDTFC